VKFKSLFFAIALLRGLLLVAEGQSFKTVFVFDTNTGSHPRGGVTLFGDTLYGTTSQDGAGSSGTLFSVAGDGTNFTDLHDFTDGNDGGEPYVSMVLAGDILYGTTFDGGVFGNGTIYAIHADGTGFTNLYSFSDLSSGANIDGANPYGTLMVTNGILYGTASEGGSTGNGTVFSLNTNGAGFTALYSFTNGNDGAYPFAGLILSGAKLYGTVSEGISSSSFGSVFALNTNGGDFTVLHNFTNSSDGAYTYAGLILADGILYGTATEGGNWGDGTVFSVNTNGGDFTVLHSFGALLGSLSQDEKTNFDGGYPYGSLVLSGDTLYGTGALGGNSASGTIFSLNTNGADFTVLHSFTGLLAGLSNSDGAYPNASLILSGNILYGTTELGGHGGGAVFSLNLSPVLISLYIQLAGDSVVLTWNGPLLELSLQSSPTAAGAYADIPGAISPYTNLITAAPQFFRLRSN
jgi:uncharacterized repeat protein (TIGR03803 family)